MGTPSVDLGTKTNSYCVSLLEVAGITLPSPARAPIIKSNVPLKLRLIFLSGKSAVNLRSFSWRRVSKRGLSLNLLCFLRWSVIIHLSLDNQHFFLKGSVLLCFLNLSESLFFPLNINKYLLSKQCLCLFYNNSK